MIIDAVFKEEEALPADFGVLAKGEKGDKGDKGEPDYSLVAGALKGSASGNPIVLSDVSPLPHEVKVKLSSTDPYAEGKIYTDQYEFFSGDGIYIPSEKWYDENDGWCYEFEDGSYLYNAGYDLDKVIVRNNEPYRIASGVDVNGAVVQRYGLNLFDQETKFDEIGFKKQEDGSWFANNYFGIVFRPTEKGQLFFRVTAKSTGVHTSTPFQLNVGYTDKTEKAALILPTTQTEWVTLSGYSDVNKTINFIRFSFGGNVGNKETYYIKDVIFSYAPAPYEPYTDEKEPLTADEEGNISIVGNGESMTLIAEDGVTISAEYNKDTNKVINDIYQKLSALGVAVVNN